jgi:hypothetical protein
MMNPTPMNWQLFHKLQEDIANIKEHPLFHGIQDTGTSDIGSNTHEYSGHQAAFTM